MVYAPSVSQRSLSVKQCAPVAQRSELTAHNRLVTGLNPVGGTNLYRSEYGELIRYILYSSIV